MWQLDTGKKQFLPHLSSPICNVVVSPNGASYIVKLADNSVMVLSARELQPFANITGLQLASEFANHKDSTKKPFRAIAALHPQHPERLLVAVPATHQSNQHVSQRPNSAVLQTFDIRANSHISRQALARTNTTTLNVSPEGSPIVAPDVRHMDIVEDGKWLATVDTWSPHRQDMEAVVSSSVSNSDNPLRRPEIFLKFWKWNASTDTWGLVTRIDAPHFTENRHASVLGLVSRPGSHEFISLGEDAILRFWCPTARHRSGLKTNKTVSQDTWKCRSVVDLKGCLNSVTVPLSTACMTFSDDGSVLAVCLPSESGSNDGLVLLIDARTGTIHYRRTGVFLGTPCSAKFLGKHLIVASSNSVAIWDTVDDVVKPIQFSGPNNTFDTGYPPILSVNTRTQSFALATRDLDGSANKRRRRGKFHIRIYDISSFEMVFQESLTSAPVSLLSDVYSGDYIIVDSSGSVSRLGCLDKASQKSLQPVEVTSHLNSGLANIFSRGDAAQIDENQIAEQNSGAGAGSGKGLAGVFGDTPSFSLPSISVLFRNVVQTLGSS